AERRVELAGRAVPAGADDLVVGAEPAERAVGELRGEGGVPPGDLPLPEQRGHQQVGVRVPLVHGPEQVVGRDPGLVPPRPPAAPAGGRSSSAASAAALLASVHALRPPGSSAHSTRSRSVIRTPRAHSAAVIIRLPCGCTSPSSTGIVPVPASTVVLVARSSPGASSPASGASRTGPSLSRPPRNVVQAPGAGVQARISRSTRIAGAVQSTRASSGSILGA